MYCRPIVHFKLKNKQIIKFYLLYERRYLLLIYYLTTAKPQAGLLFRITEKVYKDVFSERLFLSLMAQSI